MEAYKQEFKGQRKRGRPLKRWSDHIRNDIVTYRATSASFSAASFVSASSLIRTSILSRSLCSCCSSSVLRRYVSWSLLSNSRLQRNRRRSLNLSPSPLRIHVRETKGFGNVASGIMHAIKLYLILLRFW